MDGSTRRFDQEEDVPTQRLGAEPPPRTAAPNTCPKCGGAVIELQAGMDNQNGHLAVKRLDVWIGVLSGGVSQVHAHMCGDCGYTELYALNPENVLPKE